MDDLLIKVRLKTKVDEELLSYFENVPRGRRAEQMRRLALDGLRCTFSSSDTSSPSKAIATVNSSSNISSSDDDLFAIDMNSFNS